MYSALIVEQWSSSLFLLIQFKNLNAYDRVPKGALFGVLLEYGVLGPLLPAIQSLYNWSENCVRILPK